MILILKTGSTFDRIKKQQGDFEDWIADKMGLTESDYLVHSAGNYNTPPPDLDYKGIVITGSPLMVTDIDLKGSGLCAWLREKQNEGLPVLGICFGHQLLNIINGGSVINNASGIIIGAETSFLTEHGKSDKLLENLPDQFIAFKTHNQRIEVPPASAEILAINQSGIIDAIRFAPRSWGLQFHPEFDSNIMQSYINHKKDQLISVGQNPEKLLMKTEIFDVGKQIFDRFKEIIN